MLKIGLTGGIGSGKSTVCELFKQLNITIIDADVIARQLVVSGQPAFCELVDEFGRQIIDNNGNLNRAVLRALVFSDQKKKQKLDSIMHPLVYQQITLELNKYQDNMYCITAVPLLLETQQQLMFDRVLVVDCSVETQIARVINRSQLSRDQALAIISSQFSREQRLAFANDIIDNSATFSQLAEQIKKLHNFYILLASTRIRSA